MFALRIRQARLVAPVSFDREWPIETGTTSLACLAFLPAPAPDREEIPPRIKLYTPFQVLTSVCLGSPSAASTRPRMSSA